MKKSHHNFMSLALKLAEQGRFTVSPNPMVGCVIVNNGEIVGQGFHQCAGGPHAEIYALREAGIDAKGSTVYLTLEPCSHYGKTPPCVDALIHARVGKVIVACIDPNPLVSGKGIEKLKAAGIEVEIGVKATQAKKLNQIFFYYIRTGQPFVIAKWAMSLDGKTKTHEQDNKIISCPQSHQLSHQIRQQVDAILVGSTTALLDNPLLTVRLTNKPSIAKHPLRIILSTSGKLPLHLNCWDTSIAKTLVATTDKMDKNTYAALIQKKVDVIILPKNNDNRVDLTSLLKVLGERQITSLLVEGGKTVHESFFQENLVNQVQIYLAPVIIGALTKKKLLKDLKINKSGNDFYLIAENKETYYV